jgi:hypothetical protein
MKIIFAITNPVNSLKAVQSLEACKNQSVFCQVAFYRDRVSRL